MRFSTVRHQSVWKAITVAWVGVSLLAFIGCPEAPTGFGPVTLMRLYVGSVRPQQLAVIDAPPDTVVDRMLLGNQQPADLAVDPSGRWLYVATVGIRPEPDSVLRIDSRTLSLMNGVEVGASPRGIMVSPDGRTIFVAIDREKAVLELEGIMLNLKSRVILDEPVQPFDLLVSPLNGFLYVVSLPEDPTLPGGELRAYKLTGLSLQKTLGFDVGLGKVRLDPREEILAACAGRGLWFVDARELVVKDRIELPEACLEMAFDPGRELIYLKFEEQIVIFDRISKTIVRQFSAPLGANPMVFHPSLDRLYMVNSSLDSKILGINPMTGMIASEILVGGHSARLLLGPVPND